MEQIIAIAAGFIILYLVFQRWFWITLFVVLAITAFLYAWANVFHFNILAAMGLFIVSAVSSGIATTISE